MVYATLQVLEELGGMETEIEAVKDQGLQGSAQVETVKDESLQGSAQVETVKDESLQGSAQAETVKDESLQRSAQVKAVKDEGFQESTEAHNGDRQENDVSADMERKKVEELESRAMRIDAGLSRNVSVGEKVLLRDEFSPDLYLSYRSKILQAWNRLKTCKSDQNGTSISGS